MKKFPVVLFAFRRPDKTRRVLKEILKSSPYKIYIFADAPRNDDEKARVGETRKIIDDLTTNLEKIDIVKIYRKTNFGLKRNIVRGLNFVFENEDAAIVLEDDCLPTQSFFDYCNRALEMYKNSYTVSTVCGTNISKIGNDSNICLISRFFIPWGWALWKRTWTMYVNTNDDDMLTVRNKKGLSFNLRWYLSEVYKLTLTGTINTWDYKMLIMQILNNTYSLVPPFNMIKNIGFGAESSNTAFPTSASNLTAHNRIINWPKLEVPKYSRSYDSVIIKKIILTPVSIIGLLARKYFPLLTKRIYK